MKKNFYRILAIFVLVITVFVIVKILTKKNEPQSVDTSGVPVSLYNEAKELESKKALLDALELYNKILKNSDDETLNSKVRRDIAGLKMKLLFSPIITKDSILYTVKKGDTLSEIAKRFNTTIGLIKKANNLNSDIIRIGQRLKVSTATFSVVVDISQNTLTLKSDEEVLKIYTVSTGINNSTPVGTFKIINKLKDPVWYKTGAVIPPGSPENILGSRWMGLSIRGYGIHGTTQPETIGKHITAGCIRMKEEDVQELYTILPIGTEVTIIE